MEDRLDKESWLNAYFEGELSDAELRTFEQLLEANPDWKKEFQFRLDVQRAIYGKERTRYKTLFAQWEAQSPPSASPIRQLDWWRFAAAASIIGVLTLVVWFTTRPAPVDLFAEYYERYPNLASPIVRSEQQLDSVQQAFRWYDEGSYEQAATMLAKLYHRPAGQVYQFYTGMAWMEARNWEQAERVLSSINWDPGSGNFPQATNWYRALIAVQAKRWDDARVLLLQTQSVDGPLTDQAAKLLDALPR